MTKPELLDLLPSNNGVISAKISMTAQGTSYISKTLLIQRLLICISNFALH